MLYDVCRPVSTGTGWLPMDVNSVEGKPVSQACSDQEQYTHQTLHKYRLVQSAANDLVSLGVLEKTQQLNIKTPIDSQLADVPAHLPRASKTACSPVRVSQCFCVTTVEYD